MGVGKPVPDSFLPRFPLSYPASLFPTLLPSFPRLCSWFAPLCRPSPQPRVGMAVHGAPWSCIFRDCGGCRVCKISAALLVLFRLIRSEML